MPGPGAAAAIGAGIAGGISLIGGERSNKFARKEARKNRQFQERMSSTSWQRGITDMKAAGINPALAYSSGGASSPSGAVAQQADTMTPAVSSAQAARRVSAELKNMESQRELMYNQSKLAMNSSAREAAQTQLIERQQITQELTNSLASLNMFSARNVANVAKSKFGTWAQYAERGRRILYGSSPMVTTIGKGR